VTVRLAAMMFACAVCACQPSTPRAFSPSFPDNDRARTAQLLSSLRPSGGSVEGIEGQPWIVATTHAVAPAVTRIDPASGASLWSHARSADTRPLRVGERVLFTSGDTLVALDFADGAVRFELPMRSQRLVGLAGAAGRIIVVSTDTGHPGVAARSVVTALRATDGEPLWRHRVDAALGEPAASGDVVVVPYQQQSLVALDAATGVERARLRSGDDVFRWVRIQGGVLLAGDLRVRAIGPDYAGLHDAALVTPLPLERLATAPAPYPPAVEAVARPPRTPGRMRVAFQLEVSDGRARLARDRVYQVFYRHVIALDAAGALRWVRVMESDVVAAHAGASGLAVMLADGRVSLLGARAGGERRSTAGALRPSSVSLGGDWSALDAAPDATRELRPALLAMALDGDDRLLATRTLATRRLAAMASPEVTRDLLDLYRQTETSPQLRVEVARAIIARRSGADFLLDALDTHQDFLEGTVAPPLEVLAPALAAMEETRAYPLLERHLHAPATPADSLPAVIDAMATLEPSRARAPLWTFLRRYHADSSLARHPAALVTAARALLATGPPADAEALHRLIERGEAAPGLGQRLAALLDPPPPASETGAEPVTTPTTGGGEPNLPQRLSRADIHTVFASHVDDLRQCAKEHLARQPSLAQIRIALVLSSDGRSHARTYMPDDARFVACLDPRVASYRFGRFRERRQPVRYLVSLRPPATRGTEADDAGRDWWRAHARAPDGDGLPGPRWWHDRNTLVIRLAAAPTEAASARAPAHAATVEHGARGQTASAGDDPPAPTTQQTPPDAWWQPVSPGPAPADAGSPRRVSAPP